MITLHPIVRRYGTATHAPTPQWSAAPTGSSPFYNTGTAVEEIKANLWIVLLVLGGSAFFVVCFMALLHQGRAFRAGLHAHMRAPGRPLTAEEEDSAPTAAAAQDDGHGNLDIEMFPVTRPAPTYHAAPELPVEAETLPPYSAFAARKEL